MPDEPSPPSWRRWQRYRVIFYFLAGLIAVDALLAFHADLWRCYDAPYYTQRLQACRCQPWDLVLVGGSTVMAGFDPDVLQGVRWQGRPLEKVFNLGLPLATILEVWQAVEHGLAQPPRVLVYGITASDLNEERVEPQGPQYLMNGRDLVQWMRQRPEAAPWFLRQFLLERVSRVWRLFYYRDGIRLWAADQAERLWPGWCPETAALARERLHGNQACRTNGGLIGKPPAPPELRLDHLKAIGQRPSFGGFLENYRIQHYRPLVDRLLDWGVRHGVAIVLLDMPVSADLEEQLHPQEFAAYRAVLAEVEQGRGVRILRPTRQEVGLTDADFADLVHLNADGAARLSAWLRRALADLNP